MFYAILSDIGLAIIVALFTIVFYFFVIRKAKIAFTFDHILLEMGDDIINAFSIDKYNLKLSLFKIIFNLLLIIIVFYEIYNLKLYFTICTTLFFIITSIVFKLIQRN